MSNYSIRDLEHLSGIKAHTLRIWEQRYNIITPKRSDTNIRIYDDEDLKLVLNIALLKDHEYKISEIAKLSADQLSKEVIEISEKKNSYPEQIHALTIAMIDLDEAQFERIMHINNNRFGFEDMMINIIYPFLSRIGILWVTGSIGPAQEHFISNLIRQKLIVAIDSKSPSFTEESKKFVLFLPEGELHELSLLFANFVLRARNHKVIYLGQTLPFDELVYVCESQKPDYIFSAITTTPSQKDAQAYVTRLENKFPDTQILLTGYQVIGQGIETGTHTRIITHINQLIEIAEQKA
ncbi:MerR family transcriptional regulator [Emticicia sp. 21SJ11W-3]|uniref:MerR family transcriptional regulator n=1 Tax=Emticicia sp. 21SJ11W-3 TaxID=2916755 RepID=UPI00209C984B|nr:MerR family transcriptional regulator [Emticicia sp. 21SJ11W-3]UTA68139.1 MerR family transcriptional regulator [Emticicia sp. 21SJ11W-3]